MRKQFAITEAKVKPDNKSDSLVEEKKEERVKDKETGRLGWRKRGSTTEKEKEWVAMLFQTLKGFLSLSTKELSTR